MSYRAVLGLVIGVAAFAGWEPSAANARSFGGFECPSGDCSGHAAGFRWARDHAIEDAGECPEDGSNSFREGCLAYVEDPERDADLDDDGKPIEQPVKSMGD